MNIGSYKNFVIDLVFEIKNKENIFEKDTDLYKGYNLALHDTLSLIIVQSENFDLNLQEIGLDAIQGSLNTHSAVENNAVNQSQAGNVDNFILVFNNTPSKMGKTKGQSAHEAMLRLDDTDWTYIPTTTPYFNLKKGRYIYTEKGGWIDIVHFLFYAGKAYSEKINLKKQNDILLKLPSNYGQIRKLSITEIENKAISESVQSGYLQERYDSFVSKHSAYSYEDLPSDKYGAIFGAKFFNPDSSKNFGEQIRDYLIFELKAVNPESAPNFNSLPINDEGVHSGIQNRTTKPIFINR